MATFKRLSIPVLAILVVTTLSAGGVVLVQALGDGGPGLEIRLPEPTKIPDLVVYVSGEVESPGVVYTLVAGDRVENAITAAGGALEGARLACINLALRVTDEAKYHVPAADEDCAAPTASKAGSSPGLLDLNAASVEELDRLPGIGEVKAEDIVAYRRSSGPFRPSSRSWR